MQLEGKSLAQRALLAKRVRGGVLFWDASLSIFERALGAMLGRAQQRG